MCGPGAGVDRAAGVSLSWSVGVDLTPADLRPYVGSSGSNSALSLALGYNGLSRLTLAIAQRVPELSFLGTDLDLRGCPADRARASASPGPAATVRHRSLGRPGELAADFRPGRTVRGGMDVDSSPPGRFDANDCCLCCTAATQDGRVARMGRLAADLGGRSFSFARFYHVYYLIMLGPAVAALAGLGAVRLWRIYRDPYGGGSRWLLPATLITSLWLEIGVVSTAPTLRGWLIPGPRRRHTGVGGGAAGGVRRRHSACPARARGRNSGRGVAVGSTAGVVDPLGAERQRRRLAGPGRPNTGGGFGGANATGFAGGAAFGFGGGSGALTFAGPNWNRLDPGLVSYLETNQGSADYLVATTSSSYASLFILDSGRPAMALGGYQGWDRILTPVNLENIVARGGVRFFYLPGAARRRRSPGARFQSGCHPRPGDMGRDPLQRGTGRDLASNRRAPAVRLPGLNSGR